MTPYNQQGVRQSGDGASDLRAYGSTSRREKGSRW